MREEESRRIREILTSDALGAVRTVLELGSSERAFRQKIQPHISRNIHEPLAARGIRLVTTDLKGGEGVDIVGDLYESGVQKQLQALKADLVLCCNVLEHLENRQLFAEVCDVLLEPGKHLLVTVPRSYPYHPDPVDTMYRPSPSDIAALFPGFTMAIGEVFEAGSFGADMQRAGTSVPMHLLRTAVRSLIPWQGWPAFRARWNRWLWLARPYQMSLVLLRKSKLPGNPYAAVTSAQASDNEIDPSG